MYFHSKVLTNSLMESGDVLALNFDLKTKKHCFIYVRYKSIQ